MWAKLQIIVTTQKRLALANLSNQQNHQPFLQLSHPASEKSSGWTTCFSYAESLHNSWVPSSSSPLCSGHHPSLASSPPPLQLLQPSSAAPVRYPRCHLAATIHCSTLRGACPAAAVMCGPRHSPGLQPSPAQPSAAGQQLLPGPVLP